VFHRDHEITAFSHKYAFGQIAKIKHVFLNTKYIYDRRVGKIFIRSNVVSIIIRKIIYVRPYTLVMFFSIKDIDCYFIKAS